MSSLGSPLSIGVRRALFYMYERLDIYSLTLDNAENDKFEQPTIKQPV
jgi:hypothetical protein